MTRRAFRPAVVALESRITLDGAAFADLGPPPADFAPDPFAAIDAFEFPPGFMLEPIAAPTLFSIYAQEGAEAAAFVVTLAVDGVGAIDPPAPTTDAP